MIDISTYTLDNGLQVVLHHDHKRTVASVNVLYKVGSRNDPADRTGLAHLFEHLMFAGSENVANFDDALQSAGGENNAFTSADYTLYYNMLPAENLETALWLESDRMGGLRMEESILEKEKRVVIEEFRETCLDQPYGDLDHHFNPLIYRSHPYRWPVIGKSIEHIRKVGLNDVRTFYQRYYQPGNAILCLAGKLDTIDARRAIEKYFGSIPAGPPLTYPAEQEPVQKTSRTLEVRAEVPSPVLYLHYRTFERSHPDFPAVDVLCYLLGGGRSSYLYRRLVRELEYFTELSAGLNDNLEVGGIYIEGKPSEDVNYQIARDALLNTIENVLAEGVAADELQKVVSLLEQRNYYRDLNINNRGAELAYYAMLGDVSLINTENQRYLSLTPEDITRVARRYLIPERRAELNYLDLARN